MTTQIILSHSGKQHSYQVAKALNELGFLKEFYTSSYITNTALQQVIETLNLQFFKKRYLKGLGDGKVKAAWKYEIREFLIRKIYGNNSTVSKLIMERDMKFDNHLSLKLEKLSFDIMWGFQGGCLKTLKCSNDLGKGTICEMTTVHLPFMSKIIEEERKLLPEWADTIHFVNFTSQYQQRLLEEPLVANKVVAASSFLKTTLIQSGVKADKISVIPLGYDGKLMKYKNEEQDIHNRPLKLLFVGKIAQSKGIYYLLQAMQRFDKKDVRLHFIGNIIGAGKEFKKYSHLYTHQQGVSQEELFSLYQDFDVFVFPSLFEGFGLVSLEAMGAGLPIITTPNTSAAEILEDGKNGFLVPIRDIKGIEESIAKFRSMDNVAFQEMRSAARKKAEEFTWERYKERLKLFLNELPF